MRIAGCNLCPLVLSGALTLLPASLGAQPGQYTAPGSLGQERVSGREALRSELQDAPWRLGPLRLAPWIGFKDIALIDNIFGGSSDESDITITAGMGLEALVPFGSKVIWAAYALPEYVWWADQEDRRRVNGRYGAELVADFNRLDLELLVSRWDELQVVTPEFEQRINARRDTARVAFELQVARSLFLFGNATDGRFRNLLDEEAGGEVPPFNNLDRDEEILEAGVRVRLGRRWRVGLGVEDSKADFLAGQGNRSNTGTATTLRANYDGPKFGLVASLADRSLDPQAGSSLAPVRQTTGRVQVAVNRGARLQTFVYGHRGIVYALDSGFSHLIDERIGASFAVRFSDRFSLRIFGEDGVNDYRALEGAPGQRSDDVFALGGNVDFHLSRHLSFGFHGTHTEYDSDLPGFDRDVSTFGMSLGIGLLREHGISLR